MIKGLHALCLGLFSTCRRSAHSPRSRTVLLHRDGSAATLLQEAITHCKRVADMGDKVDPGASLNPAMKARAAAKETMKHLSAMTDSGA